MFDLTRADYRFIHDLSKPPYIRAVWIMDNGYIHTT
jgi:hypothetical protein